MGRLNYLSKYIFKVNLPEINIISTSKFVLCSNAFYISADQRRLFSIVLFLFACVNVHINNLMLLFLYDAQCDDCDVGIPASTLPSVSIPVCTVYVHMLSLPISWIISRKFQEHIQFKKLKMKQRRNEW